MACRHLGRNCRTAHPSQSSPCFGNVRPHLAGDVHVFGRVPDVEEEISCPTACAASPHVGRSRSQPPKMECPPRRVRDASVLVDQHKLQWVNKLLTVHQTRHSGANVDRVQGFRILQEVQSIHCRKIRQHQSSASRLPLSRSPAPKEVGNSRATCWGIVDEASASPAVHNRMTGNVCSACPVDLASWRRRQIIWDCVAVCSTQNFVPGVT